MKVRNLHVISTLPSLSYILDNSIQFTVYYILNMSTIIKIHQYIQKKHKVRPEDLRLHFSLGRAIIHRHLKTLLAQNLITKVGKPPIVFYLPSPTQRPTIPEINLDSKCQKIINANYLFTSPTGTMTYGVNGFSTWAKHTHQTTKLDNLAKSYCQLITQVNKHRLKNTLIDATPKLKKTFKTLYLNQAFYLDFYSLPQFGKTILGQKILYAKQSQSKTLIKEIANHIKPFVISLINSKNIQAVGFIPPTIPRLLQIQVELKNFLKLPLPHLSIVKAHQGQTPIAQKSLSKLTDRIQNAKSTIYIKHPSLDYSNILLIDDAVGSGATLDQTAKKLKKEYPVKKVFGLSLVGSYKGFDVISEI
jgi:hypothetical protein